MFPIAFSASSTSSRHINGMAPPAIHSMWSDSFGPAFAAVPKFLIEVGRVANSVEPICQADSQEAIIQMPPKVHPHRRVAPEPIPAIARGWPSSGLVSAGKMPAEGADDGDCVLNCCWGKS